MDSFQFGFGDSVNRNDWPGLNGGLVLYARRDNGPDNLKNIIGGADSEPQSACVSVLSLHSCPSDHVIHSVHTYINDDHLDDATIAL